MQQRAPATNPGGVDHAATTIDIVDWMPALAIEWQGLGATTPNLFASWEWASSWWRYFGRARPLRVVVERGTSGAVRSILPLYLSSKRPARVARIVGHGPADLLGPACAGESARSAYEPLARCLRTGRLDCDLVLAECLPAGDAWDALSAPTTFGRGAFAVVQTGGRTWDEYLAGLSRKVRKEIRWRARRLSARHDVTIRLCRTRERVDTDLTTLIALHRLRWGNAGAFGGKLEPFLRDFIALAFDRGWCRLWLLEVDGDAAAASLVFRHNGIDYGYQMGRDPKWSTSGVGLILLTHLLQDAFDSGIREFRFLRGDEDFKRRFATDDPGLITIAVARTRLGRAAISAAELSARFRPVRRALGSVTV